MIRGGVHRAAVAGVMIACAMTNGTAFAEGPLHVDITDGVSAPLMVAVPDVRSAVLPGVADGEPAGAALARIVRDDLASTGLYRLVSGPQVGGGADPAFGPWQQAGAQALVRGTPGLGADRKLTYECALYDVFGAKREFSATITVAVAEWRRAGHKCADLVFRQTTGDPGHFDTRIVFTTVEGAKTAAVRRLAWMDYDGANPVRPASSATAAMPRLSPDGRFVVYATHAGRQPRLALLEVATGTSNLLKLPPGAIFAPRFSPDGRTLVFAVGQSGNTDIFTCDLASGRMTQLTTAAGADTNPSFSPDGTRIVFESDRSGRQQLYVMARDGTGQTRISFGEGSFAAPAWSPRGDLIAFTLIRDGWARIAVMRPDGSRQRVITSGQHDEGASWAPSGHAIAFSRTQPGDQPDQLWTTDLAGRVVRQLPLPAPGGFDPDWSGVRP